MTIKIVITGATGFIGTALCRKLEERKEYSIIKVTRSQDDMTGFFQVTDYKQTPSGDILIHLGEDSDREKVNKMSDLYIQDTRQTMKSLLMNRYKKIIYISSSTVYSDKNESLCDESMPTYANDTYSTLKLENEKKVLNSGGIVVRLSNVIGNGMSKNNVLSDVLSQLSNKHYPVTIRDVSPVRDFIMVDDVVDAIFKLMQNNASGVFNVGSGVETSINQLVKMVLDVSKQKNRKVISIVKDYKYSYNVLSIEKINNIVGWSPKFTLVQSIYKIINSL